MTCRHIEPHIDDYLDGQLDAVAAESWRDHIAGCRDCDRVLGRAQALRAALAGLPVPKPSAGFFDRALTTAAVLRQPARQRWEPMHAGALAAGIATVALLAGLALNVDIDHPGPAVAAPDVAMTVEESRTINLVFASAEALDAVSLTVDLPPGIELARYPGQHEVRWATRLQAGRNVLPLELIALGGGGGELVATLRRDDGEKVFRINIAVQPG